MLVYLYEVDLHHWYSHDGLLRLIVRSDVHHHCVGQMEIASDATDFGVDGSL